MLENHGEIIAAIHALREVRVTWPSKEDGGRLQSRRCAPMDYGISRVSRASGDKYHFWDFESDQRNQPLSLRHDQIASVEILDTHFDPAEFMLKPDGTLKWKPAWPVTRVTWGRFN